MTGLLKNLLISLSPLKSFAPELRHCEHQEYLEGILPNYRITRSTFRLSKVVKGYTVRYKD